MSTLIDDVRKNRSSNLVYHLFYCRANIAPGLSFNLLNRKNTTHLFLIALQGITPTQP